MTSSMRTQKPGSVKNPCVTCRARHVKCDDKAPRCQRCEAKGIECIRTTRATIFRKGTLAGHDAEFPTSQNWVNSRPRKFYINTQSAEEDPVSVNHLPERRIITASSSPGQTIGVSNDLDDTESAENSANSVNIDSPIIHSNASEPRLTASISPEAIQSTHYYSPLNTADYRHSRNLTDPEEDDQIFESRNASSNSQSFQPCVESPLVPFISPAESPLVSCPCNESSTSLQDTTEACLLRYFIEELAHWFDTCDPLRHFQLVVPQRARGCPPLLHAIFAVSARHLARVPRYQTKHGIVYYGQLLPDLTRCTGVEYALKCIPFLQNFHTIHNDEYQENLMAATVILRQYEEIEDEQEEEEMMAVANFNVDRQVNFLAIIQEIIRIAKSAPTLRSLANAAFVISVRQEVYCAFTRERAPQIHVDRDSWEGMSLPNKVVMHAAEVMKWRWGNKLEAEWSRLKEQHLQLVHASTQSLVPILERAADKARREVFPIKWYSSDAEVVAAQHLDLVKMILIAENPRIEMAPHTLVARRKAESQVRELVLNICGIGNCHPRSPPALVSAAMAIMAYGDYFTDASERRALSDVIEKTRRYYAWPVRKAIHRLHLGWESSDSYDDFTSGVQ